MRLIIQIQALVVSFVYGIVLSYIIRCQYKYMFNSILWYRIIFNIFFVFDIVLIYFYLLRIINDGAFHIYFLFLIVIGYILGNSLIKSKQ